MKPVITSVTSSELPAIQELATNIWREHYPGIISSAQIDYMLDTGYTPEQLNKDLTLGTFMAKIMVNEVLAGFAAYGPVDHEDFPGQAFKLHKLYLLQSFHGQGLGSMFLHYVEDECQKLGAKTIVLNVNKHNAVAIKSYQRNGYRNHKSVLEDIGKGFFMDDFIMSKSF